jgi:hypothetical protein
MIKSPEILKKFETSSLMEWRAPPFLHREMANFDDPSEDKQFLLTFRSDRRRLHGDVIR